MIKKWMLRLETESMNAACVFHSVHTGDCRVIEGVWKHNISENLTKN